MFRLSDAPSDNVADPLAARRAAVLESALRLLVAGGEKALTTAGVARAANCSKESLYKWFGDRDGLLAAVITFQASKVGLRAGAGGPLTARTFRAQLAEFAADLLGVLAGDVSLALNRLAIGQASREGAALGRLVLSHGRRPIEVRLVALLEAGRAAGHVAFDDPVDAYRTLYGLVVRDLHVRMLLGEQPDAADLDFPRQADAAVHRFLRLHGAVGDTADDAAGQDRPDRRHPKERA